MKLRLICKEVHITPDGSTSESSFRTFDVEVSAELADYLGRKTRPEVIGAELLVPETFEVPF